MPVNVEEVGLTSSRVPLPEKLTAWASVEPSSSVPPAIVAEPPPVTASATTSVAPLEATSVPELMMALPVSMVRRPVVEVVLIVKTSASIEPPASFTNVKVPSPCPIVPLPTIGFRVIKHSAAGCRGDQVGLNSRGLQAELAAAVERHCAGDLPGSRPGPARRPGRRPPPDPNRAIVVRKVDRHLELELRPSEDPDVRIHRHCIRRAVECRGACAVCVSLN